MNRMKAVELLEATELSPVLQRLSALLDWVLYLHKTMGNGHFFYRGQVEDSATAEISRSQQHVAKNLEQDSKPPDWSIPQVWQWLRHQTQLEDDSRVVSRRLVTDFTREVMMELRALCPSVRAKQRLHTAADMFLEVVLRRDFPEFITTYLNQDHTFLSSHSSRQVEAVDADMHRSKL